MGSKFNIKKINFFPVVSQQEADNSDTKLILMNLYIGKFLFFFLPRTQHCFFFLFHITWKLNIACHICHRHEHDVRIFNNPATKPSLRKQTIPGIRQS